tara:strand:+ start:348 stop:470 length:123 start_codon:yes stop_codon:yes gene_type:complete
MDYLGRESSRPDQFFRLSARLENERPKAQRRTREIGGIAQ